MKHRILAVFAGSALAAAATVGVLAVTGVSFADPATTTIHACVKQANGQLRIVSATTTCLGSETAIQWNQQGPAGPIGPVGPAGPSGATVTFEQRSASTWLPPHDWNSVQAYCLAGEKVTGGGFSLGSIGFNDKLNVNGPFTEDGIEGWMISVHNDTDYEIFAGVTAICAQYPS